MFYIYIYLYVYNERDRKRSSESIFLYVKLFLFSCKTRLYVYTDAKPGHVTTHVPICLKTVTYIVAAVVINDQGEILMMQEAKASCSGKWYLPAGRVCKNENLIDAVKREVLEETGLIIEPKTLILVECANGTWFRFVFTGDIVGGMLKTPDQANEESLQACWVRNINDLPLRANDIIYLLDRGRAYVSNETTPQHPHLMPTDRSHAKLLLRVAVTSKKRATYVMHTLHFLLYL